ncbi:MAG: ABC transporter ATP-binding protein [Candidatus Krumholzibacteriia bacterium]
MRTYARLLEYVLPYWRKVVLLFITVTLFASLSGVSLTLIHPFLRIIIYDHEPVAASVERGPEGVQGIPLPAAVDAVRSKAQSWFEARMYAGGEASRLARFCVVLLLLFLVKSVFAYLQTYLTVYLEQKVLYRIRNVVFSHLQNLPLSFFEREKTGHIISRITNDVSTLRGAVVGAAASLVRNGLMTLIALVVVLAISWKLSLLTFVVIPLNMMLIGLIGDKLKKRSYRTQAGMADLTALLEENVSGMRVVKAFNMGAYERQRFGKINLTYMRQFLKMKLWGAVSSPTSELLGTLSIVVILWYGGTQVIGGVISPENLVLFVGAMIWVVTPVKNISKLNNVVQESIACADRVFAVLDIPQEPLGRGRGGPAATFESGIRFEGVGFEYIPGRRVLHGIDLSVSPGEVIALVGPSGAGKTTLVDLVPRFYDVTEGRILFDGVDVRDVDLSSLRGLMGMVTQEIILFNDTVRNNIAYGMPECPLDDIVRAAKAANADGFIRQLASGYETIIGERGTQLSGGQRQRISIARAILKDPSILIFDEATSALDTESEILVQEAIDRLLEGRTTFVIAHRLSTIQNADKILVLEEGVVREFGTHSELIDSGGAYKKLYDLQFGLVS